MQGHIIIIWHVRREDGIWTYIAAYVVCILQPIARSPVAGFLVSSPYPSPLHVHEALYPTCKCSYIWDR